MSLMEDKIDVFTSRLQEFESALKLVTNSNNNGVTSSDSMRQLECMFYAFKSQVVSELAEIKKTVEINSFKINQLEQYSRRNCVLLHGVPEQAGEDCVNVVLKVFHDMKLDIQFCHIDRTHRIGPQRNSDKTRAIIVKFCSYFHKHLVFSQKKVLKGSGVYVSESLTKVNFNILQEAKKIFSLQNVWTLDGRIIIKHDSRKFTVTSLQQLHDLVHALRGDNVHSPPQASSTLVPNVSPPPAISTPEAADSTFGSAFSTPVNQNQYKGSGTSSSLNKKKKKRHGRRF
ncbi:hypothetical protein M8J77_018592 [Diaphorina citri]|nr:hypothetical protein M8J77_018592 [Diaphorina citri]